MEVNNGGFSQYFFNSSGDFSNELVVAFITIGANATAAICQKAIAAFGRDIPDDRYERQEMLDELESNKIDEILEEAPTKYENGLLVVTIPKTLPDDVRYKIDID